MADVIDDKAFGFRLTVPDEFTQLEIDSSDPDTLYKFIKGEPTPEHPAMVIQIQRMRGVISPTLRIKDSDIPDVEGVTTTLQALTWKGIRMDVIRNAIAVSNGVEYVVYGLQYPLSGESVQLQVGGSSNDDEEIYALFTQLADEFKNTKPLYSQDSLVTSKLTTQERLEKLIRGIIGLVATALFILFIIRRVKGAFSKKKAGDV